jgi:hypothetical protein
VIGTLISGAVPPRVRIEHAVAPIQLMQMPASNHGMQADPTVWRYIAFKRGAYPRVTSLGIVQRGHGNAFAGTETLGAAAALNALLMITLLTPA